MQNKNFLMFFLFERILAQIKQEIKIYLDLYLKELPVNLNGQIAIKYPVNELCGK